MPSKPLGTAAQSLSAQQKVLIKRALQRDIDWPLCHEDERRIVKLHDALAGGAAQIEPRATACAFTKRLRGQLLVSIHEGSETFVMRIFSAYRMLQKALAAASGRAAGSRSTSRVGWPW